MKMSVAEVADKYTILCLKVKHGVETANTELEEYEEELKSVDYADLANINKVMWELEETISHEHNLETIGILCVRLRAFSLYRVAAKNKIAEAHSQPLERKSY